MDLPDALPAILAEASEEKYEGCELHFYSKSLSAAPGSGAGESVGGAVPPTWRMLPRNFRSEVLSNFAAVGFAVPYLSDMLDACGAAGDGSAVETVRHLLGSTTFTFATLEHAFHFCKFVVTGYPIAARNFAKESGSALSKSLDGGEIKAAGGKGRKGLQRLSAGEVAMWNGVSAAVMKELWRLKFSEANPYARRVLLLTYPAKLMHIVPRQKERQHWRGLEELRDAVVKDLVQAAGKVDGVV